MEGSRLLERRARPARPPEHGGPPRRRGLTRAAALIAVVVAALAGGLVALSVFQQDKRLSVGTVQLSVEPFHDGTLDLYVPLVDWGVRFPVVRLPVRINVDVRAVDRNAVVKLADAGRLNAAAVWAPVRSR